jgi:hypothetical protein
MRITCLPVVLLLAACGDGTDEPDDDDTTPPGESDADTDVDTDTDTDVDTDTDTDTDVDTGDTGVAEPLAIVGTYTDQYGTDHVVTDVAWVQTYYGYAPYTFLVTSYDNAAAWVVTQNDAANPYSPGLYSRFDWVDAGGHLFYCQTSFDSPTEAAALALPRPDDTTPWASGCGAYGFPWTDMTP